MKVFRDFAKQMMKQVGQQSSSSSAAASQNQQNIKDHFSKRVNNFADYLETGKEDELKQSQEDQYKQNIRQQYQKMDQQDELQSQSKQYEQMTGFKMNVEQETQKQNPNQQQQQTQTQQTESVPFMITRAMKIELYNLGYEIEQINDLTPKEAIEIIKKKKFYNP